MCRTSGILLLFYLFTICSWTVDATIEIFDHYGRRIDKFKDREPPLDEDIEVMEGFIVTTDPSDACFPVEEPHFLTNFTYGKFALINGSDTCGYKRKIHNAGQAGFDFAVIFDPISGPLGYLDFGFEPHIPSVLVSFEDGMIIRSNYLYNNSSIYNYRIRVKPNVTDLRYYMYLFGAVIGICFFVMLLFMMCLLIKCIQERRKSRRNRLSSRQIKQIPTAKFSKGDQYDVCAICLEDYTEGEKLRILPCSHAYHAKCIDPWLMNNRRNCPLCKRKITFGDSGDESDSEDSELTSPAENTPLLTSPSNHGQAWGTFVNPVQAMNDMETGGPSSLPDSFYTAPNPQQRNSHVRPHPLLSTQNRLSSSPPVSSELMSDSESENLLPPSHFSVNDAKDEGATNQTQVQVNFVNPFEDDETSSSLVATI